MPALLLACLAYLSVALPSSAFGLLWPSMRLSFGVPVGALGVVLVPGILVSVVASAVWAAYTPSCHAGPGAWPRQLHHQPDHRYSAS